VIGTVVQVIRTVVRVIRTVLLVIGTVVQVIRTVVLVIRTLVLVIRKVIICSFRVVKRLTFILSIIIISSCSLKKRLYNKGFYVSNSQSNKKPAIKDTSKPTSLLSNIKQIKKETNFQLLAIASKAIEIINKKQVNYNPLIPNTRQTLLTDPCDTIFIYEKWS
jgi:hypothetical protein